MINIYLVLIGAVAGILCGLLGLGGGVVIVPALLLIFNFEMKMAVGTSLLFASIASFMGVVGHQQLHNINWKFGLLMTLGAAAGVFIGVRLTEVLPGLIIKRIFGFFLLMVSIKLIVAS